MSKESVIVKGWELVEGGLRVDLQTGVSYLYKDGTADHVKGLEEAESKGHYFATVIRKLGGEKIAK